MQDNVNMSEVIEEIKNADEAQLKKVIEDWFEKTRTDGLKLGAQFISVAIYGVIEKNLIKTSKPSLRDYKRAIDGIMKIVSVQLKNSETQQNDYEEEAIEAHDE